MVTKQKALDFFTVQREIENNIVKPIYLIYGEENYLHTIILDKFKENFSKHKEPVNYETFFGEDLDFNRLVNSLQTLPLGGGIQCIIIKQAERIKVSLSEKLHSIIDKLSFKYDNNLFLLLFSNDKKIPPHINTEKITNYGSIVSLPKPNTFQTKQWIKQKCRDAQKEINEEAIYYLQRITENDFGQISNELDKLFCFLGNSTNKINKEDIIKNLYGFQAGNIFNFVDAVGDRKTGEALFLLRKLMNSGEYHPLQILAMLNRQIKFIFKAKIFSDNYKKIKGDINLPPFVIKKLVTQSKKYKLDELKKVYHYLLKAEIDLKTSSLPSDIVLEQLVMKITK
jgi:DNA polymerase-3 subunit delta